MAMDGRYAENAGAIFGDAMDGRYAENAGAIFGDAMDGRYAEKCRSNFRRWHGCKPNYRLFNSSKIPAAHQSEDL